VAPRSARRRDEEIDRGVTTRGATLAALLATLGRPSWWLLGLAGFLARGGILLFLFAIVSLPSPLALSNVVAPFIVAFLFGGLTPFMISVVAFGVVSLLAWVLVGAWLAAATEIVLIRDARQVAAADGIPTRPDGPPRRWLIVRVTAVHLLAHVPLVVAIVVGSFRIASVAYTELLDPFEVVTPLAIRVIREASAPISIIVLALIVGELAGGLAARRVVVAGESIVPAVARAYLDLFRRPLSAVLPSVLTLAVLAVDLAAMLAAVAIAWTLARGQLAELPTNAAAVGLAVVAFAAAWCLALIVAGLITAWRSTAMTVETERAAFGAWARSAGGAASGGDGPGTIGASAHRRPGDWSAPERGGSL
jgi:hypothetical protein